MPDPAAGNLLARSELFSELDPATLAGLERVMRRRPLKADQALFHRGDRADGCYVILEGVLKVDAAGTDGAETLVALLGIGDVVGEIGLIDGRPRSATVTALKPSRVAFLDIDAFHRFAAEHPSLYRHMLRILGARLRTANESLALQHGRPLAGRLAGVLLRMADGFGRPLDGGRVLIHETVSQSLLAQMSGAARENVSRQMSAWRRDGLVSKVARYYVIEDLGRLGEIAGL
ncbi:MAG: Crp/Fnr family transcriptional regulator [Hyphomicrobiaceae bacterium]